MKWFLALLAMFISYYLIDPKLALFLHKHNLFIFKILSYFIAPFLHLSLWGFLTLCALRARKHLPLCLHFLVMIGTFMFIAGILKITLGRARPDFFIQTGFYGFSFFEGFSNSFRSFPSSHAAVAFGTAYLWLQLKKQNLYLFAIVLTSSRLFMGEHYLSDVIAGGMLGIFTAQFSLFLTKKIEQAICLLD